jgi:CRP/FNR family putative post-exponential-phase nitrogen-starvation transcriptional regulator
LIGCSYRQLQRVLQLFLDKKYIKKIKRGTYQIIDLNALNLLGEDVYQF